MGCDVRFGSLAAPHCYLSSTAASGGKAAVQDRIFRIKIVGFSDRALNVRFSPKRTLRLMDFRKNEGPLSAKSSHQFVGDQLLLNPGIIPFSPSNLVPTDPTRE